MPLLARRSFSTIDPNTPLEQTVEKERRENMNSKHANCQKNLASFLEEIPKPKDGGIGSHWLPCPANMANQSQLMQSCHTWGMHLVCQSEPCCSFWSKWDAISQKARDDLAQEWLPVNPKIKFGAVNKHCLLCVSPAEVSKNNAKRIVVSLPMEQLVVWWVSERID
jgi:hypothetical protein